MTARGKSDRKPREPAPSPEDQYKLEKARRDKIPGRDSDLIAAAKEEYLALLAQQAVKGKGGRPKKKASPKAGASPDADTDMGDEAADLEQE